MVVSVLKGGFVVASVVVVVVVAAASVVVAGAAVVAGGEVAGECRKYLPPLNTLGNLIRLSSMDESMTK